MATLYNTKTKKPESLDGSDLQQALLSGTHSYAAGEKIAGYDPDGNRIFIPAESVPEAIRLGYRVRTGTQQAVEEYVDDNQGLKGAAKVALGQFADEALMGLPEMIFDKTADPLEVAKKEALKKEHDLANTVGGVAGFGASMLVPGLNIVAKGATKAGEAVAGHIAEKLVAKSVGEVSKHTAGSIARDVVKRMAPETARMATEGLVMSAPHAATEAMLADSDSAGERFELAGESLLAGVGLGAMFGAGGQMAKGLFGLSKKAAQSVLDNEATITGVAKKVAKVVTGVNEADITHYLQNAERVNQAPPVEAIRDMIDDAWTKQKKVVEDARLRAQAAETDLKEAYKATRFDLSRTRPPESLADEIVGALENEKSVLGSLSEQADDALERSGQTFRRDDLLAFLDQVGGSIGVKGEKGQRILVSDEALSAAHKLAAQRDRIALFGKEISAPQLRAILQEVRRDIKWNKLAGDFNDTLNNARLTFQKRISSVLKDQVPEYDQYMRRMSSLAESLEEMNKVFGTRERAAATLNSILTPRGATRRDMLERFSELTGRNFMGELDEFQRARTLLEDSRKRDISAELLPEMTEAAANARAGLEAAERAFEPIRKLTPDRAQAIIRNQGFKNANINDRRALEELSRITGTDFLTLIKDRNVLDAFSKEYMGGSRRTLLGALAGSAVGAGGPVGGVIGAAVGAAADVHGATALKAFLDSRIRKEGLMFAEQAMKKAGERLEKIPEVLRRMSGGEAAPSPKTAALGAVLRLLGEDDNQQPKAERMEKLREKMADLYDEGALADRVASLSTPISDGGAPNIGAEFNRKMAAAYQVLNQIVPRETTAQSPFAPKRKFVPSEADMAKLENALEVIMDPFAALDRLESGTLTRTHVDTMKAVYPKTLSVIQTKVMDAAADESVQLPYPKRIKLGLLLDIPLDPSLSPERFATLQETFAPPAEGAPAPKAAKPRKTKLANEYQTKIDRISSN